MPPLPHLFSSPDHTPILCLMHIPSILIPVNFFSALRAPLYICAQSRNLLMPEQALPIESKWCWVFLGVMRDKTHGHLSRRLTSSQGRRAGTPQASQPPEASRAGRGDSAGQEAGQQSAGQRPGWGCSGQIQFLRLAIVNPSLPLPTPAGLPPAISLSLETCFYPSRSLHH